MRRELVIVALILACLAAPNQAFEVSTASNGTSLWLKYTTMEHISWTVTPRFQQLGYVGVHLSGTLREFSVTPVGQPWNRVTVLGLELANGTLLQISFYCMRLNGTLVSTTEPMTAASGEPLAYCGASQLPYHDGSKLNVMGTLLTPSQWQPNLSTPTIVFSGDFYVMEIES